MKPEYEGIITQRPQDVPRVRGSRITIYHIMDHYRHGDAPGEIAEVFRLTESDVRAAIAYIEDHREETDAVYARIMERESKGNPPEIRAMLEESHKRMLERVRQLEARKAAERRGAGDVAAAG